MTFRRTRSFSLQAAAAIALLALPAVAAEVPDPLPDPDGKPADMSKPVQVYILMGQSNMLGFGKIKGGQTARSSTRSREEAVPLPGRRRRQLDRAQGRPQRARHGQRRRRHEASSTTSG